ncbi:MAG: zinc ABC transporter substrate-binding protein [Desulfurococcaceae archaeon]|nr:zinc ABC transporter substrate-binding protein [Desulfurococcaceae archaeon]
MFSLLELGNIVSSESTTFIIVTAPPLKGDVERVVCTGDIVISLVPPGVDIHEYQLSISNLDLLKKASLIVSTGHTSFELKIKELVERGELSAILLDTLEIPGLKLSKNPVTGQLNYHMPVKDPVNYVLFISRLVEDLASLNPEKAECYYSNYIKLIRELYTSVLVYRGDYTGLAIVDSPHSQYYVEWIGFKVVWMLKYEEDVPVTTKSLEVFREFLANNSVKVVFVAEDFPHYSFIVEEASKYNVLVVKTPSPTSNVSILDGLKQVVEQLKNSTITETTVTSSVGVEKNTYTTILWMMITLTSGIVIGVLLDKLYVRRRT